MKPKFDEPRPRWTVVALVVIVLLLCWREYGGSKPSVIPHVERTRYPR